MWQKDGVYLRKSDRIQMRLRRSSVVINASLSIANLDRADEGTYRCIMNDTGKLEMSLPGTGFLVVKYPPNFMVSPSNQTKKEGDLILLRCEFEGKPFPLLTWRKNGQNLTLFSNVTRIGYKGDAKLQITSLDRRDEGAYTCVASNYIASRQSSKAFITVNYPPVIIKSPGNETRNESNTATLNCTIEGKPFPEIEWIKDGKALNIQDDVRFSTSNSGNATHAVVSLKITNLKNTDDGYYSCIARNMLLSKVMSTSGLLTVNFLRNASISEPLLYSLVVGQRNVSVHCSGLGYPRPSLSWYKEGRPRVPSASINRTRTTNFNVSKIKVGSRLFLTSSEVGITFAEAGNYTCEVYSSYFDETRRKTIEIVFQPQLDYEPKDAVLNEGSLASFYCNASGIPQPVISWSFSGGSLPQHTVSENKLLIEDAQNTGYYEGQYTCTASSRAGRTQASASLTVDVPPRILKPFPQSITLQLGQTLNLKCDVYGDPVPWYNWTSKRLGSEVTIKHSETKSILVIADIRPRDAAYYGCTATNRAGTITLKAVLVDVDTSLSIINGGENFIATAESNATIRCVGSSDITPQVKIIRNEVELKAITRISSDKTVVIAELTIDPVSTEDSGVYTCVTWNRQKSAEASVTLIVNVPIKVEVDVKLEQKTFTNDLKNRSSEKYQSLAREFEEEITKIYVNVTGFERVEVLSFSNGSVNVRFRVVFKIKVNKPAEKPPLDTKIRVANVVVRKVTETNGVIGNLKFNPETLKPLVEPDSPTNLTVFDIMKTGAKVAWEPPLYHETYRVTHYVIEYKKFGEGESWESSEDLDKHINQYEMENLDSGTKYLVRSYAVNFRGKGLLSKTEEIETLSAFWEMFLKIGVPVIAVFIVLMVIVIVVCKKRRNDKKFDLNSLKNDIDMVDIDIPKCFAMKDSENFGTQWKEIPRDHLIIEGKLGSGAFGQVMKGTLLEDDGATVPCAVKTNTYEEGYRDLRNELEIIASIEKHPNIINFLGACTLKGPLYVIVEFAENGSLLDYLKAHRERSGVEQVSTLSDKEKHRIALDVARGMEHLVKNMCIHRDLAARNVLLDDRMVAKVSDFGLARDVYERGFYEKTTQSKLPLKWMSIEAMETFMFTRESDIWSFGVLLWEIETGGKMPYAEFNYKQMLSFLRSGKRLPKPPSCSDEMYSLMLSCWEMDPSHRPSFSELTRIFVERFSVPKDSKVNETSC